ncbi:MAG: 50S ribosomal protein L25 [Elusimicrobia bacterium]|jgi:large subunit ribosomal protein L25|nr:50S ribosomal protein L25 [Elusimicrobiota bacterium]
MVDEVKLDVQERKVFKRSRVNELRGQGSIPAVLYGPDIENVSIFIDEKEFKEAIYTEHGENVLIKIKVGKSKPVTSIIKEIQVNPVSMKIIHVDFAQISLTEKIEVNVPVEIEGKAPGVETEGGVIDQIVREVRVSCLPTKIPNKFIIDVSELNLGESITIAGIKTVEGVEILKDDERLVVHVVEPTEIEEPEEGEEEIAEPEVIGAEKPEAAAEEAAEPSKEEPAKAPEDKETKSDE